MHHRLRSALIILVVVVLDWISKVYIRAHVSLFDIFPIIPRVLNIVHAENPAAAFSLLANAPEQIRYIFLLGISIVVMAVLAVMLWRGPSSTAVDNPLMRTGLALVFAGALGNFIDRAFRGTVTDFVQVFIGAYEFPSFNVADSAITIGACLLVWELWSNRKAEPR